MSEEVKNLFASDGAVTGHRLVPGYAWPGYEEAGSLIQRAKCEPGKTYTVSMVKEVIGQMCFGFYLADGTCTRPNGYMNYAAGQYAKQTLTAPSDAEYVVVSWCEGERRPMLVDGTTPAAWAPADGESLAGGDAQMSANLWSDSTASMQIRADGTYLANGPDDLSSAVTGLSSLTENQTVHMGASLTGPGAGVLKPFVEYKDAAGNTNCVGFPSWQPTDSWQRFEGTCVVPSGMTVCGVGFENSGATGDIEVSNPVFCYGSTGIVKAAGSVTVASINDVASTTRWYLLQSSTLTAPAAPTASPPGGSWAATEPTYTEGSTNSLYTCDQTVFSDGTWAYSSVSLSTSYEASKTAYNKAAAAAAAAAATDNHFWWDADGAHVSSTGDHDTSGFHQLMSSVKNAFMHGSTELMTTSENLIELGKNSTGAVIKLCGGLAKIKAQADSTISMVFIGTTTPTTMGGIYLTRDVDNFAGDMVNDATRGCLGIDKGNGGETAVHLCAQTITVVPSDATHSGTYDMERLADAIQPVVLYNGGAALDYDTAPGAGTAGTVTLSETAAHFKELTIFGKYEGYDTSVTLTNPDGRGPLLQLFIPDAGPATRTYIKSRAIAISGTHITDSGWAAMWLSDSTTHFDATSAPEIAIIRVEGRR